MEFPDPSELKYKTDTAKFKVTIESLVLIFYMIFFRVYLAFKIK